MLFLGLGQVSDWHAHHYRAVPLIDAQQQFFSGLHFVFSEVSLWDRLGWNTPRFWANAVVLLCFITVAAIAVFFALRKVIKQNIEEVGRPEELFAQNAQRCNLSEDEAQFVKLMALRKNPAQPHVVFQSLPLFEQSVDAHVRALFEARPDAQEMDMQASRLSEIRDKLGFAHIPLEHPIASTRNISIGQAGTLFSKTDNRPIFRKVSVVGNTPFYLTLRYNVDKEEIRRVAPGHIVRFAFARQSDGLYGFQSSIAKADKAGAIELYHSVELKRNQLRQYVRIETNLPLRFRLLQTHNPETSELKQGEVYMARLSDISGGGLSFIFDRALRLGDTVSLNFDLPTAPFAGIMGKIVHLSLREKKDGAVFKNHVQFVTIESRNREKIISYVFEKERQLSQWR